MNGVEEGRQPYSEGHPLKPKNMADTVVNEEVQMAHHWSWKDCLQSFQNMVLIQDQQRLLKQTSQKVHMESKSHP